MSSIVSSNRTTLRVGTRESKLARLQTEMALSMLKMTSPDTTFEVVALTTHGDKVLDRPLAQLGGTGVFVKELEDELLANRVDLVVHSLKDMPTDMPPGLVLGATLMREDPRDVFVSRDNTPYSKMPAGSRIATSSRRRAAQLSILRDDVTFVDVRGNVPTRLKKLDDGQCDGMILAAAGLLRLGYESRIAEFLEPSTCVPAAGQGALAIECREDDAYVLKILTEITDLNVSAEVTAERAFLRQLGGGCSVPIGVLGRITSDQQLHLIGCIADGQRVARGKLSGSMYDAAQLGIKLAEKMIEEGAGPILDAVTRKPYQQISPP